MPAKPKPATAKPKATATKPLVCLVTPADMKHRSQDAFEDELQRLGLTSAKIDYTPYYGAYSQSGLRTAAQNAVKDASARQKAVIVAAGTMATSMLQGMTTTIAIIQAAGGGMPTTQTNVTGFYIDAQGTSESQFDKLSAYNTVTILFDHTNEPPSNSAYLALAAYATKNYPSVTQNSLDIQDLADLDYTDIEGSFMLIPNMMFYNNCSVIAQAVIKAGVPAIYPEREYKKAHGNNTTGIKVLGHNIPLTYRWAATYVDSILDGSMVIPLPALIPAIPDTD